MNILKATWENKWKTKEQNTIYSKTRRESGNSGSVLTTFVQRHWAARNRDRDLTLLWYITIITCDVGCIWQMERARERQTVYEGPGARGGENRLSLYQQIPFHSYNYINYTFNNKLYLIPPLHRITFCRACVLVTVTLRSLFAPIITVISHKHYYMCTRASTHKTESLV